MALDFEQNRVGEAIATTEEVRKEGKKKRKRNTNLFHAWNQPGRS
jgi:hypothetical protein